MHSCQVQGRGGISVKVIAHSLANKEDLLTLQIRGPKFLDAEFEKHRMISSNSSSDRAIPLMKMLEREYFLPEDIRLNGKGMQGFVQMAEDEKEEFHQDLKDLYGYTSKVLKKWDKVHKQHLNRYLLGFSYQNKVATANSSWFRDFLRLRLHEAADPAMYEIARCMQVAMNQSIPDVLEEGQWHLPYVQKKKFISDILEVEEWLPVVTIGGEQEVIATNEMALKCSVARCARVSYMKHDNSTPSVEDDIELYNALVTRPFTMKNGLHLPKDDPIHASPCEHQAVVIAPKIYKHHSMTDCNVPYLPVSWQKGVSHVDNEGNLWSGNFRGFIQYRKMIEQGVA